MEQAQQAQPTQRAKPLLEFDHVSIAYDAGPGLVDDEPSQAEATAEALAVHDVCLSVAPSEVLGLVGASGSGKSTLVKAAMRLLDDDGTVTAGVIRYRGADIAELSTEQMRELRGPEIAMIFQDCLASLCPTRTIGDQVWETARAHMTRGQVICHKLTRGQVICHGGRAAKQRVEDEFSDILERIGLDEPQRILRSHPGELSGGMGQRVGIALALMMHPKLILADEPTSALDVTTQAQVIDELKRAQAESGCAMIVVTHSMGVAAALCDRIAVMHEGCVIEVASTHDILHYPRQPYTRELIAAAPRLATQDDMQPDRQGKGETVR